MPFFRFLSVPFSVFCVVMFFLPWVEISCVGPQGGSGQMAHQSGLQASIGLVGVDAVDVENAADKNRASAKAAVQNANKSKPPFPAFWLLVCPG